MQTNDRSPEPFLLGCAPPPEPEPALEPELEIASEPAVAPGPAIGAAGRVGQQLLLPLSGGPAGAATDVAKLLAIG